MGYGTEFNYLRTLNQEAVVDDGFPVDEDQLAKDLEQFTNTTFFDIDGGQTTDFRAPPVKPDAVFEPTSATTESVSPLMDDFGSANLDFLAGDFSFEGFANNYTSPTIQSFPDALNLQPIQPNPQSAFPQHVPQHQQPGYVHNTGALPPQQRMTGVVGVDGSVVVGQKRKAEHAAVNNSPARILSFEEQSRLAAEEDKRKRNTAASARFRVKKKQREQALEKTAKEMADKVSLLESRISALETENKWLKGLVTEKHGGGKDDILKKLLKEFAAANENGKGDHSSDNSDDESSRRGSNSSSSSTGSSITAVPSGGDESSGGSSKKAKRKD